jgi:hypothetical protein
MTGPELPAASRSANSRLAAPNGLGETPHRSTGEASGDSPEEWGHENPALKPVSRSTSCQSSSARYLYPTREDLEAALERGNGLVMRPAQSNLT